MAKKRMIFVGGKPKRAISHEDFAKGLGAEQVTEEEFRKNPRLQAITRSPLRGGNDSAKGKGGRHGYN